MKHSPTPWILTETPTHVTVRSANNELIFHDDKRLPEVLADARLVSAAPDLLEVLEELLSMCQRQEDFHDDDDGCMFERASAAIAKARGEK